MTDAPPTRELLEQHRRDIEALDRRILHLVCERLELARQIGEVKTGLGVPLRDFQVETAVYRRFEEAGRLLGLDDRRGRDLARFLIEKAVEEQAVQQEVRWSGDALDAVVAGGKGGMGRWISRFLAGQGHRVRVLDPGEGETSFPEIGGPAEAADADLVVLAVPMSACSEVLAELAAIRPRGVVAEMASVKAHLADDLDAVRAAGVRVVSFHPMFGPDVRMLEGRTIVVCTDGAADDVALVRGLFAGTSARLVEMSSAEHDRRMGVVLGMTHLLNLAFGLAVARCGIGSEELADVASVTFGRQLGTTRQVAWENPVLYFEIQRLAGDVGGRARHLADAVGRWAEAVEAGDRDGFEAMMVECRHRLAELHREG